MRRVISLLIISATLSWSIEEPAPAPALSKDPLTTEQIAIYRVFLQKYLQGNDDSLNVANTTDPLDFSFMELKEGKGCLRGISLENFKQAHSIVHTVGPDVAINSKIVIVDPAKQTEQIKENDPSKALLKGRRDVDELVKTAFSSALFTFSEIGFDKKHTWAVLTFSFLCGSLCGHGGTVILHRVKGEWKITGRNCGYWQS